jgi:hypothetical protein
MSAAVTVALTGVTILVLALLTYAAFRYVPMTLAEEEVDEPTESEELREGKFAG